MSIQKYVYASNKLRENLGASYIVDNIYAEPLESTLAEILGEAPNLQQWRTDPTKVLTATKAPPQFEVGYIGGGNALLFFTSPDIAHQFIKRWTLKLLKDYPGLLTAVAQCDDFNLAQFQDSLTQLFKELLNNKNTYFPNRHLPKHGITADCPLSGYSAEVLTDYDKRYISRVSEAKRDAADKARDAVTQRYAETLGTGYFLPDDLNQLGQIEGKSHLATVYIDGNQMGSKFQACKDIVERRKLSIAVDKAVTRAFGGVIAYVKDLNSFFEDSESGFKINRGSEGRILLPIRPIIVAGDEVTFVTDGRLGVHLAEIYLKLLGSQPVFDDGSPMSACAGIAITRTKYPFYRAYEIAEELCSLAKVESRENPDTSWLDFHVAYSGISGSIIEIRENNYSTPWGNLHYGPYQIEDGLKNSLAPFKRGLVELNKWSKNKIKEFRTVLSRGDVACQQFLQAMEARGLVLPETLPSDTNYALKGWENKRTPYYDLIEMLDFYPIELAERTETR
mgnify:CR=1 FL=1